MSVPTLKETFDAYWRLSARSRAKRYLKVVHPTATQEQIDAIVDSGVPQRGTEQQRKFAQGRGRIQYSFAQFAPSPGLKADGTPKKGKITPYDAAPGGPANKAAMQAAVAEYGAWAKANPNASQAQIDAEVSRLKK